MFEQKVNLLLNYVDVLQKSDQKKQIRKIKLHLEVLTGLKPL